MTERTNDAITIPKRSMRRLGLSILFVLVLAAVGLGIGTIVRNLMPADSLAAAIDSNEYQYVTLTNGDSYFGKLSAPGGDFYYMRHVYTLSTQGTTKSGVPLQHTLIKVSNEIHGPEDLVVINRQQIVYMENLRPNGCAAILMTRGGPCP
jgi:hypothetical protein